MRRDLSSQPSRRRETTAPSGSPGPVPATSGVVGRAWGRVRPGSGAGRVLDPDSIARVAEIEDEPAIDLIHQLLLGHVSHPMDEAVDLAPDVARGAGLGERGRGRVAHRLDLDHVEAPP